MRDYRLYELDDQDFEHLVTQLCMEVLGTGTVSFAPGRDGGRDGRFNGTAQRFPSTTSPHCGKFIIQAKHTQRPGASCKDTEFARIIDAELPRPLDEFVVDPKDLLTIDRFARDEGLDVYGIVHSNGDWPSAAASVKTRTNSAAWFAYWIAATDTSGDLIDNHVYAFNWNQTEARLLAQRQTSPNLRSAEFARHSIVIAECVQVANDELMRWLAKHPEDLYRVHPGTFELIIAEIFRSQGFEVEVIGQWNQPDGGLDILAIRKDAVAGDFRVGIQCKRYTKTATVRADLVWALEGRLEKFHLHKGVVATTARFEKSTLREARENLWRIELRDFDRLRWDLETWGHYTKDTATGLWLPK